MKGRRSRRGLSGNTAQQCRHGAEYRSWLLSLGVKSLGWILVGKDGLPCSAASLAYSGNSTSQVLIADNGSESHHGGRWKPKCSRELPPLPQLLAAHAPRHPILTLPDSRSPALAVSRTLAYTGELHVLLLLSKGLQHQVLIPSESFLLFGLLSSLFLINVESAEKTRPGYRQISTARAMRPRPWSPAEAELAFRLI